MRPELFRIPWLDIPIHSYGFLIVAGFLLATWLANREARRRGIGGDPARDASVRGRGDYVYDFGMVMLLSGIVGARLWYYIENYRNEFSGRGLPAFFEIWKGGLVFYGGAIGGVAGGLAFLRWRKLPVADFLDAIAPFIPIGMAFGRLGCFMNGCCFGKSCPSDFPLAIQFPSINNPLGASPSSPAFLSQISEGLVLEGDATTLPVYPTQLFEAGYDFLLCALLYWFLRARRGPKGIGVPLVFVFYGLGRFSFEFLRGDNPPFFRGLTISQTLSIPLVFIFGVVCILLVVKHLSAIRRGRQKKFEKPLTGLREQV